MSSGGGVRDVGTVTGGMAMMNFDEKTRPYTRDDYIKYILSDQLSPTDKAFLVSSATTWVGVVPTTAAVGFFASGRLDWKKISTMMQFPYARRVGRAAMTLCAFSVPHVIVQQSFTSRLLDMDDHTSGLALHTKRFMLGQRSSLMFQRTATREVSREEQASLAQEGAEIVQQNRGSRVAAGGNASAGLNVNLALSQQALTPVAQSGYKPLPDNKVTP